MILMKKLLFILFILICLCNIGSCKKKHECVVSDEYKYNDTHHYKECSNAECENIFYEEEHHFTYSKDNKKCDLCSYEKIYYQRMLKVFQLKLFQIN